MVCALTEYAVAVTSAAANNVVANFCMLISDFDAKKNVCAGKRAQPISRAKQEQHHRGAMSMLSLRPGNFALIVGIALCAAQRLSRPRASDPGKDARLASKSSAASQKVHCFSRGSR
jgi:hypothetical protein